MARFRSRVLFREYGRSQHSNKKQALKVLTARIHEKNRCERAAKVAAERKSLVGGGDRI